MSSRVFYSIAWLVPICSALFYFSNKVFLTEQDSPIMLNFGSSFFSLIFSSFIFIRSEKISTLKNIDKISWIYIIFIGILMGVLARLVLLYGQSLTTASNAGFLVRTSPVFTIVLGYFFLNEKITRYQFYIIALMIIGVFFMMTEGHFSFHKGDALVLVYGAFLSLDFILSKKILSRGISPPILTFLRFLIGTLAMSLVLTWTVPMVFVGWHACLLSGFFLYATILTRQIALKHIKVSIVSGLVLLSPVFTALFGTLLLRETLSPLQAIGGLLIALCGYLLFRAEWQVKPQIIPVAKPVGLS